jgi:hypothetical protein
VFELVPGVCGSSRKFEFAVKKIDGVGTISVS